MDTHILFGVAPHAAGVVHPLLNLSGRKTRGKTARGHRVPSGTAPPQPAAAAAGGVLRPFLPPENLHGGSWKGRKRREAAASL